MFCFYFESPYFGHRLRAQLRHRFGASIQLDAGITLLAWITAQPNLFRLCEPPDLLLFDAALLLSPSADDDNTSEKWPVVDELCPDHHIGARMNAVELIRAGSSGELTVTWVRSPGRFSLVLSSQQGAVGRLGEEMAEFYGRHGGQLRIVHPEQGTRPVVVRLCGGGWRRAVILVARTQDLKASSIKGSPRNS